MSRGIPNQLNQRGGHFIEGVSALLSTGETTAPSVAAIVIIASRRASLSAMPPATKSPAS